MILINEYLKILRGEDFNIRREIIIDINIDGKISFLVSNLKKKEMIEQIYTNLYIAILTELARGKWNGRNGKGLGIDITT